MIKTKQPLPVKNAVNYANMALIFQLIHDFDVNKPCFQIKLTCQKLVLPLLETISSCDENCKSLLEPGWIDSKDLRKNYVSIIFKRK